MSSIKFGTSGWRATIADGYTAANLQKLAQAIASHITENTEYGFEGSDYRRYCAQNKINPKHPIVVVGYDTRYMSEYFARLFAYAMAANAISVKLADAPAPTPVVAWTVVKYGAVGGVTITASEGDYTLNGLKWTPFWGGPAIPEVTDDIESRFSEAALTVKGGLPDLKTDNPLVELCDFRKGYFEHILSLVDTARIKKAKLRVAADPLYGASIAYLRPLLEKIGIETIGIHENRDVLFGNKSPYTGPDSLAELSKLVSSRKLDIGIACDCDGDRFGIVDADGAWVSPNEILSLVLEHLVKNRGIKGRVCRSVVTSHCIDAVAKSNGLDIRETPVGFKFIGELMRTGQYILGGEESGGLSIRGHVPEKDGILACLLMIELLSYEKKPLSKIRKSLQERYGQFVSVKSSVSVEDVNILQVTEKLQVKPPLSLGGFSVWRLDQTDGFKFILRDGSWLGLRPSGTEPIVRIYAEATSKQKLNMLVEEGKKIVRGKF